jgi:hypothetical protein
MNFQGFARRAFEVALCAAASMHDPAIPDKASKHGMSAATFLEAWRAQVVVAISADFAVPVEVKGAGAACIAVDGDTNRCYGGEIAIVVVEE